MGIVSMVHFIPRAITNKVKIYISCLRFFLRSPLLDEMYAFHDKQTDPVTPWQARDQFERLHGDHDKNTAHAAASVVANTPSMDGRRRLFLRSASSLFAPLTEKEGIKQVLNQDRYGIDEARARRILQTSCAEGDPFTITSSAFPSLEGCVLDSGFVSEDDRTVYNSSSAVVWSVPFSSTTTDSSVSVSCYY